LDKSGYNILPNIAQNDTIWPLKRIVCVELPAVGRNRKADYRV
jgi:hypothetical protein